MLGLVGVSALLAAQVNFAQGATYSGTLDFAGATPAPVTLNTGAGVATISAGMAIQRFDLGSLLDGSNTQITFTQGNVNTDTTLLGVLFASAPNDALLNNPASIGGLLNPVSNADTWLNANVSSWNYLAWGNVLTNGGNTNINALYSAPLNFTVGTNYYAFVLGGSAYTAAGIGDDNAAFSLNVTAVPEPEIWVSMVVGLGLLGLFGRRRQAAAV